MSCPYYKDYTRMCIQFFQQVLYRTDFPICESEDYHNCLAYKAMSNNFRCKYLQQCSEKASTDIPQLAKYVFLDKTSTKIFEEILGKYCTSESQHVHCAGYKLFEQGIQPPPGLLPNGKKIRLRDIILKREIIIE
jgi:hypothetical protein